MPDNNPYYQNYGQQPYYGPPQQPYYGPQQPYYPPPQPPKRRRRGGCLSTLLVLSLLAAGCSGLAFAEVRINNQIKGSEGDTVVIGSTDSQQRGLDLVLSTGDQNTIDMPNIHAYIQPAQMYVDAPGDHSIYVYQGLKLDKKKIVVKDPIKNIGSYTVAVKLHPEVTGELKVKVEGM